jgi:hypothetical protein
MTDIVELSTRDRTLTSASSICIGVDLGNQGGVAELTVSGELIAVHPMPVLNDGTKGRPTLNAPLLAELIARTHATQLPMWNGSRHGPQTALYRHSALEGRVARVKGSPRHWASACGF